MKDKQIKFITDIVTAHPNITAKRVIECLKTCNMGMRRATVLKIVKEVKVNG